MDERACAGLSTPFDGLTLEGELGMDAQYGEVSLWRCAKCGRLWLRYLYELEAFASSGHWYLGAIPDPALATVDASRCRETLERLAWYFYGGSYFDGADGQSFRAVVLTPELATSRQAPSSAPADRPPQALP